MGIPQDTSVIVITVNKSGRGWSFTQKRNPNPGIKYLCFIPFPFATWRIQESLWHLGYHRLF